MRAGRLLEGGTTAPARAEIRTPFDGDVGALAVCCRSLLAETADTTSAASPVPAPRVRGVQKGRRTGRHTSAFSAVILCAVAAVVLLAVLIQ
ncbi:hypothetical protein [Streptomyces sp. PU-14G]|uniref:hypothetical protein n=1 Tax=Streptomyces sp. PU-14G TaxID=2800808 RepID=UPI0034DE6E53